MINMIEQELQRYFGLHTFMKGQREVIAKIVACGSAAAIFPTGGGKSLCYQLPAMLLPHMTLVVSPLLALMKDQIDFLKKQGIPAARLDSTLNPDEYHQIIQQARNGELNILMISVERFKNERFRTHLKQMNISLLVVDEAHCISEWGHNFRPDYLKLPAYRKEFAIPQVLLLTATATPQVIEDMCEKFEIPVENVMVTGFYRSNLHLHVTPVPGSDKKMHLLKRIKESAKEPTIVYVTLQKTAEDVAGFLHSSGIKAFPYHAGMAGEERETIQNRFLGGEIDCVVATIAFGMGIDKKDISRVIHFDLPKSIENYSQEIGRSGRDGRLSFCEVLANRDNISVLENFVYGDTPEKEAIDKLVRKILDHDEPVWEIKELALSYELDIRLLPLKTLLVYLEMEGIIHHRDVRFDEYMFKYKVDSGDIIGKFAGERKVFVQKVIDHCTTKKVWTYVDIQAIAQDYSRAKRERVIAALEYFSEQGWIELQSKHAIEGYDILKRDFDADQIVEKMCNLFQAKEKQEIQRIYNLVEFFESSYCISLRLARYFGEEIAKDRCGHCSFCKTGPAVMARSIDLPPLSTYNFSQLTGDFLAMVGEQVSELMVTKYLCGISSPALINRKASTLSHYGCLGKYPFLQVKQWVCDS